MKCPTVCPSIRVAVVEDGYVAFDVQRDQVHHLNPTAALILEYCDGTHDLTQIQESISPLLPDEDPRIVAQWVESAEQSGLITFEPVPETPGVAIEADELTRLAHRLREEGHVQQAFLCQQRAAELKPDDAAVWYRLGEFAHIVGKRDVARTAYEKYLEFKPDDVEIQHILVALSDKPPPDRASDECIQQLYARFSSFYDHNMREDLDFRAPEELLAALAPLLPSPHSQLGILDLGCGTGFAGQLLKPWAARLVGIDLSPEMIQLARKHQAYDTLEVAEITAWLSEDDNVYDIIVACDSLIYFGELGQVLRPAAARLAAGGLLAFTNEIGDQSPYQLSDSGRYTHDSDYIRAVAAESKFVEVTQRDVILREEYGESVHGIVTVLRTASTTTDSNLVS